MKLYIMLVVVLVWGVGSAMITSAFEIDDPTIPHINSDPVSILITSNSSWNQSLGDSVYWRLDGTNDPPSADWNMNNQDLVLNASLFRDTSGGLIRFDRWTGQRGYISYETTTGSETQFSGIVVNSTAGIHLRSQMGTSISGGLDFQDDEFISFGTGAFELPDLFMYYNSSSSTFNIEKSLFGNVKELNVSMNITSNEKICDSVGCIGTTNNIFNQVLNTTSDVTFNKVSIGTDGAAITQSGGNPTISGDTGITFASAQTYSPSGIFATPGISFTGNGSSGMFLNNTGVGISDAGVATAFFNTGGSRVYSAFRADSLALTTDLPVTEGGTGASSFNARGVVLGGTTSTGALQSLANPTSATAGFHVLMHSGSSGNSVWSGLKFKNSADAGNIFYATGRNYSDNDNSLMWDHGTFGLHIKDPIMLFNSTDAGEDDWIIKNEDGNLFIRNIDRNRTALQFGESGGIWINETTNITQSLTIGGSYTVNSSIGVSGSWNCTSYPNVTITGGIVTSWSC